MAKICAVCGEDCSDRPRVKDKAGRYYCKPCEAKAAARSGFAASAAPAGTTSTTMLVVDGAEDVIPIEEAHVAPEKACPVCMLRISADAVVCVHCGYDERKGIQSSTLVEGKRAGDGRVTLPCAKCGYDLTGLHAPQCPECGTIVGTTHRERIDSTVSRDVVRREYTKPLVMLAVGLIGVVVFHVLNGEPGAILLYFASYAIALPIGLAVLWFCCLGWIGFGAPFHLDALRLAGIYAMLDLYGAVTGFLPIALIWFIVGIVLYVWMLAEMMDMDTSDAIIVAMLTYMARLGITFVVFLWLF
ncbi:MAG: hypothetical protein KIS87_05875 [Phycisphaeraceae bacterium]|nr:hypothetical protein [Phycisphaeraceae bacterium]